MSFWHDKKHPVEITWSNTVNPQLPIKFYPRYRITADKFILDYATGTYEKSLTSDFQSKKIFVWIGRDGSNNFHRMSICNYSSHIKSVGWINSLMLIV